MKKEKILNIYKPLGKSPLEAIELFRKQNPEYKNTKLGYAGRLDPMAEGVLLVLIGEELKNQKTYWALNKEYEAEILLGVSTDTYDILGIAQLPITNYQLPNDKTTQRQKIKQVLNRFQGQFQFAYPPYSSRTVNGKPLFWWARRDRLSEIEIPKKVTSIKKIKLITVQKISKEDLEKIIIERINLVNGDFRQKLIKITWKNLFKKTNQQKFVIIKIRTLVSSGTYVRSIAHELGKKLNTNAVLFHLVRTRVGNHKHTYSIRV